MRIAHVLRLSTLLLAAAAVGCGGSAPPPASAAPASASASSDALVKTKGKKGPISKGKQTLEKRREYNAASPNGPPSEF